MPESGSLLIDCPANRVDSSDLTIIEHARNLVRRLYRVSFGIFTVSRDLPCLFWYFYFVIYQSLLLFVVILHIFTLILTLIRKNTKIHVLNVLLYLGCCSLSLCLLFIV